MSSRIIAVFFLAVLVVPGMPSADLVLGALSEAPLMLVWGVFLLLAAAGGTASERAHAAEQTLASASACSAQQAQART